MIGIYEIVNKVNGKRYVGSSLNLITRERMHIMKLCRGIHANKHLQLAWNKYGESVFEFRVLEECSVEELVEREQFYLDQNQDGYNGRLIAESNRGTHRTVKDCIAISAALRLRCGEKNPSRKLSQIDVDIIRAAISPSGLDKRFNVHQTQIWRIRHNKSWKN